MASFRRVPVILLGAFALTTGAMSAADAAGSVAFNPLVATWVANVSQAELEPTILDLTGERAAIIGGAGYTITTRSSSSGTPIRMAEQYVYEQLRSYGLGSVAYQAFPGKGGAVPSGRNVIGEIKGVTKPNEIVLISGHLDNRPWDGRAYGADDDASGVAAMLYAARSMAGKQFARTIRFVAFGCEENAPWTSSTYGSGYYAAQAKAAGENIVAMIDADALAYNTGSKAYMVTRPPNKDVGGRDAAIAAMWKDVVATYLIAGIVPTLQASGDNLSDHGSFWRFYPETPAVMLIENDDPGMQNPYWHAVDDKIDKFNWSFYLGMVQSYVGVAAHQAQVISKH